MNIDDPLPPQPQSTEEWLEKIHDNTVIIKAWVRLMGWILIITAIAQVYLWLVASS